MAEALALVEIGSVATGLATVDALTKRATVDVRGAGVVEPGRFLVLFTGDLREVEESWDAALERAEGQVVDKVLLARVHEQIVPGLEGLRRVADDADCVGLVEGQTVARTVEACDRALKDADVLLAGLRVQPGLGGRAYFAVTGAQHDVEAAVDAARSVLGPRLHRTEVIPRPTRELLDALLSPGAFQVTARAGSALPTVRAS